MPKPVPSDPELKKDKVKTEIRCECGTMNVGRTICRGCQTRLS